MTSLRRRGKRRAASENIVASTTSTDDPFIRRLPRSKSQVEISSVFDQLQPIDQTAHVHDEDPTEKLLKKRVTRPQYHGFWDHVTHQRRYFLLFGILLGGMSSVFFASNMSEQHMHELVAIQTESLKLMMREKLDYIWSQQMKDELLATIDYRPLTASPDRPGLQLFEQNVRPFSPIVMIPGFTSTGLEIWNGSECSRSYFRQRMWGTSRMLQQFMLNQKCWLQHVMLNTTTGLDPDGIKLRPASGLEAADYVIGGYWVWGKIIENLADIGYDTNNMFMAAYDWRLSPQLLERRDRYYTKLKYMIEMAKVTNDNRKVVMVMHSYGFTVAYHFLKWVESEKGGKGGPKWVEDHIEALIDIAGTKLGSSKALSTLLSGEMKDTAELGQSLSSILEFFFGPPSRSALARSWASVFTMLPFGGEAVWGNASFAPDDLVSRYARPNDAFGPEPSKQELDEHFRVHGSNGAFVTLRNKSDASNTTQTTARARQFLQEIDPNLLRHDDLTSQGVAHEPWLSKYDDPRYWSNPLESTLPKAPSLKLFCLYGIGKPVERSYIYRENHEAEPADQRSVPFVLDTEYQDPPWIASGIRYVDGDGTVPLVSLGYMCARGWKSKRYNPSGVEVRIREYKHNPVSILYDPRGGPATSDHVDIMGNHDMITDILHIASRNYDEVPEVIHSSIHSVADQIDVNIGLN